MNLFKKSDDTKTNPQTGTTVTPTETFNENPFDFGNYNFDTAGVEFAGTTQPKWKWSYNGTDLTIWPVDPVHGQPHHIEITGMEFWKLAQGRVYVDPDGTVEITVWADRASDEMQDDAVLAVDEWLLKNVGKIADEVSFLTEGGYYRTIDPNKGPDLEKLLTTYFGYPVKVNTDGTIGGSDEKEASN